MVICERFQSWSLDMESSWDRCDTQWYSTSTHFGCICEGSGFRWLWSYEGATNRYTSMAKCMGYCSTSKTICRSWGLRSSWTIVGGFEPLFFSGGFRLEGLFESLTCSLCTFTTKGWKEKRGDLLWTTLSFEVFQRCCCHGWRPKSTRKGWIFALSREAGIRSWTANSTQSSWTKSSGWNYARDHTWMKRK